MRVFYVFTAILTALIFPLCIRLRLTLSYNEKLEYVKLGWLFFSFKLYPRKDKAKKTKKNKKTKSENKSPKEKALNKKDGPLKTYIEQEGISGIMYLLGQALDALGGFLGGLRRGLLIHRLEIYADIGGDDAAQTAIEYSRACAVIYPLVSKIISCVRTTSYDVDVKLDFLALKKRAELYTELSLRPIRVLYEAILLVCGLVWRVLRPVLKLSKAKSDGERTKSDCEF